MRFLFIFMAISMIIAGIWNIVNGVYDIGGLQMCVAALCGSQLTRQDL
jgi:hypothetical protein